MPDHQMDSANRARGILASWERRDLTSLETLLSRTLGGPVKSGPVTTEEQERMELLCGIASQMRSEIKHLRVSGDPGEHAQVCFRLLRHLAESSARPAVRSAKVASFPY